MIKVSETARQKVVTMMSEEGFNASTDFVRVGVKSGGCSGLSYELKFDKSSTDSDKVFEDNTVRIIVDKKSFLYLVGTTLEYSGGLNGKALSSTIQMPSVRVGVEKAFRFKNIANCLLSID